MKKIIILIASIQLIMFFPLQSILDKQNHYRMTNAQTIVFNSAQKARIEGHFTAEIKEEMLTELGEYFNRNEISYQLTETPKYRLLTYDESQQIYFEVKVPIKKVFIANNFFGIKNEDNKIDYQIKGVVASELLDK